MGCFLGCFSLSSDKKRRKPTRKTLPGHRRICGYGPLHSSDLTTLNVAKNPEKISNSNLRCEAEEKKETKARKRVRFNLNVRTYEPIPRTYDYTCSDDEAEEAEGRRTEIYAPKENPKDLGMKTSYPSNYRYRNCADSYEDEDQNDLDDEYYYTDDGDEIDYQDEADDEDEVEKEKQAVGARDRSKYVTQVLNPVQNLAQWKAVKTKPVVNVKVKQPMKENFEAAKHDQVKPLLQEIAIDASLSNWLASPKKEMPLIGEILNSGYHQLGQQAIAAGH
ncbi:PREDICTED: uncharacterized protein LOC104815999 [Tarenaya hassleriana]|uniref:uncharacterized protein LOC104815999 n=1 Tax=Tarenaya hassleriana TaxID=28532 RepID=UPI00053C0B7F|nr:PREDICTED: uncharacterized protein LOC104815999 [Tarenaya hassleriana]